jgi:hypothetical protein
MCTLFFRHSPDDEYPLAILSNRDEAYDRPSGGWDWRGSGKHYFAPIDLEAGGTWIGLSRNGVVVALTNIFPGREDSGFRSRGELVTDLLQLDAAAGASTAMAKSFTTHSYNTFNLLVADPLTAFAFSWAGDELAEPRCSQRRVARAGGGMPEGTSTGVPSRRRLRYPLQPQAPGPHGWPGEIQGLASGGAPVRRGIPARVWRVWGVAS